MSQSRDLLERAVLLHQSGLLDQAETLYRKIISRFPNDFHALHFSGVLAAQKGRLEEAAALLGRAVAVNSQDAAAQMNYGNAQYELGRITQALAGFECAISLQPNYAAAYNGRGLCLLKQGLLEDALSSLAKAIKLNPEYPEAHSNHGNVLQELNRLEEAVGSYGRAIQLRPNFVEALYNLGNALFGLRRHAEALRCYDQALNVDPRSEAALYHRGNALMQLGQTERAVEDLTALLQINPEYDYIRGDVLHAKMLICDWDGFETEAAVLQAEVRAGKRSCSPFGFQAVSSSVSDLFRCASTFASDWYPVSKAPLWAGEKYRHKKIRLGYVGGEFREHATSYLIGGLFERHDKSKFELFAFDNGFDDGSQLRHRLKSSFDHFFEVSSHSDRQAAQLVREHEIDILVNLNGYFGLERAGIFAQKPAPIQVNYLGFPGTMGHACIDYILADRHVIFDDEHPHYSEKVVYLPHSYQVNDAKKAIAPQTISRTEAGLPESGIVFCCFNNTYKFTPSQFDVWMRILSRVDGSVLWLLHTSDSVVSNLQNEAKKRGVSPERLVFAPRVKLEDHLARHRLADLFLDSLPYNAHTTASDALWAGLPLLTCVGSTFPGRVGASLLRNVGLPELVTASLEEYEAVAVKLATDKAWLPALREKLSRNRLTSALFNTDEFRENIEKAYIIMWERYERGQAITGFAVPSEGNEFRH